MASGSRSRPHKGASRRAPHTTRKTRKPTKRPARPRLVCSPALPAPTGGCRHFVLDVPWGRGDGEVDARTLARAYGARTVPGVGMVLTARTLPEALEPYRVAEGSWGWLDEALLNRDPWVDEPTRLAPASFTRMGSVVLREGQVATARAALAAWGAGCPEFLDASEVGTGKTFAALGAVRGLGARRCLVIAPASVLESWRTALGQAGDGGCRFVLVNPESLHHLCWHLPATSRSTASLQAARGGVGKVSWDVVITDEGHVFKNPGSQVARIRERVIAGPAGSVAARSLVLSATAGRDPSDLAYLHRGLAWRLGATDPGLSGLGDLLGTVGIQVGVSRFDGSPSWDGGRPEAAGELEAVRDLLFGGQPAWGVRRVADWGAPPRHLVAVDLDAGQRAAYEKEWGVFRREMAAAGRDLRAARSGRAKAVARARGLAAQTRYRQKAGLLHADAVAAHALTEVAAGAQVAVSCEFLDTARRVRDLVEAGGVPVAWFTGENHEERESERLAFQRGVKPVVVFTPTAGFSLHAGEAAVGGNSVRRVLLVAEPRWSPLAMVQVEGRTHRDGHECPVFYFYASGTVERKVLVRAVEGMGSAAVMMGQERDAIAAIGRALGVGRLW